MLSQEFSEYLSNLLELKINRIQSVSGGDISLAFLLETNRDKFFLKINSDVTALNMFLSEEKALKTIAGTNTIDTPKVLACDSFNNMSFLLMEYIEAKRPNSIDFSTLGNQLAQLHKVTTNDFGFDQNNFIGRLHQSNKKHSNWNDFYVEERLLPQFKLAQSKGLLKINEIPNKHQLKDICSLYFKSIKPSLLHGDLWSGNFIISTSGKPYLIDPSSYFGHGEVDIAMSTLFGGFGASFYDSYHKIMPVDDFTEDRIQLYQLYYLLVHLNMFGATYYSSVKQIVQRYL